MPRPLSSRLMSIQSIPFSAFFLCVLAAMLLPLAGDPHYARLPGYQPVHVRFFTFYVEPWAKLWSDRLFLAAAFFLIVAVLFQLFIRYYRKRER